MRLEAGSLDESALPGQARQRALPSFDARAGTDCAPPGAAKVSQAADRDALASYLGDRLIAPLRQLLRGKRVLLISPDGPLAVLPFELLRLDGHMLLVQHDISLVHSLSVLKLLRQRQVEYAAAGRRKSLLAMGHPAYQLTDGDPVAAKAARRALPRGDTWPELPGTALEVGRAQQLFADQGSRSLLRKEASETRLRELSASGELAGYRYLLFSAHGYFDPDNPANSALVLMADGDEPERDGYVTVGEWPALRLRSDLALLSACDTGRGQAVNGEGLMGLAYALYVAGNISAVLTLWPIADEATAEFIGGFLERVKAGAPASVALAATKRDFARHRKVELRDPYFWAAFQLYGI